MHLLTFNALEVLRDRKGDLLGAADERVRALRLMFKCAKKAGKVAHNLALEVEYVNKGSEGHHTWSTDELERYEAHHPVGTKARLALDLVQFLGLSRMDVVKVGPRNVRDQKNDRGEKVKVFTYRRGKTGIEGTIGMPPALLDSIAACPLVGTETYLVNDYGRPFTSGGFANRFKKWCREAGVPEHCSLHGIRKAAAVRAAEAGATTHEVMAMLAWCSIKMAEHYTVESWGYVVPRICRNDGA